MRADRAGGDDEIDGHDPFDRDASPDDVRLRRLAARVDARRGSAPGARPPSVTERLEHLCAVTVDVAGVDGAGVTVMGGTEDGLSGHRDQLAATGTLSRDLEELQFTAGEGPCADAFRDGMPVLAADLAQERERWLGFVPAAVAAGAAAVFSLPLQVGAIRLGTLDLHRGTAGGLSPEQLADALAVASLATETLLDLGGPGDPAPEPAAGPSAGWLPDVHADVHVASGMVSTQHGIDVRSALLRIRAHAFARGEPIGHVARRIIDRELELDRSDDGPHDGPTARHQEGQP